MATTPNYALPYPLPSAPVANGAADIQALADRLDSVVLPGMVEPSELTAALAAYIAKAIVDAKGDLIAATGPDALARLAVGADGQVLTADSSQAAGLRWATAAGGGGGAPSIGTTLPGSPADGQEAVLVDSLTAPTYAWSFRYVAGITDANRWVFTGGSPLYAEVLTLEAIAGTTYGNPVGPNVTVPRAGVYRVVIGFTIGTPLSGVSGSFMSYAIGAAAAVDADALVFYHPNVGANPINVGSREQQKSLAAGVLAARYKYAPAGAESVSNRWMRVTPVRVA